MSTELQTSQEVELSQIKTAVHAKIAEVFKSYGKEYKDREGLSILWESPLYLDVSFCSIGSGFSSRQTKGSIQLELSPTYYGNTVGKDGLLTKFRRITRKVPLNHPLELIYKEIEKFIGNFPKWLDGIREAQVIEMKRNQNRQEASERHALLTHQLADLTGYTVSYSSLLLSNTPYSKLEISRGSEIVNVALSVPLSDFETLHRLILAFDEQRREKQADIQFKNDILLGTRAAAELPTE